MIYANPGDTGSVVSFEKPVCSNAETGSETVAAA